MLNLTSLGTDCGISAVTAREWLGVLEASYLTMRLPPYHRNFGKRLVKTPKLYFLDVGLMAWLLGIRDARTVETHAARGALFETWVVSELVKQTLQCWPERRTPFPGRDSTGLEVDVVYEQANGLQAIEIKSGATFASDWPQAVSRWQDLAGSTSLPPHIVFGGEGEYARQGATVQGWREFAAASAPLECARASIKLSTPMPRNIEIKARIDSVAALVACAEAMADQGPIAIRQDDSFFTCPNGRLKLRAFSADEGELIFYQRADAVGPKTSFYARSPTASPDTLREALSLAYGAAGRVRKQRTLFLVGRTRIHLDEVEGLGAFLELEVVLADDEDTAAGVAEATLLMARLGVSPDALIKGAYVDLLAAVEKASPYNPEA